MTSNSAIEKKLEQFELVRKRTEDICTPLQIEDYVVQPTGEVSPPKWHLGHTTWFFETFILEPCFPGYRVFDERYNFVFNSYYESKGARVIRTDRGNLTRPSVSEIYQYRAHVNDHIRHLFENERLDTGLLDTLELGIHHEQQHQELLLMDIKYILGHNPLFPTYEHERVFGEIEVMEKKGLNFSEGVYWIGFEGKGFCFDNELGRHQVYLDEFEIDPYLVSNAEFLEFIEDCGYGNYKYWHAQGWDWVNENQAKAPLYWHLIHGQWMQFGLNGLQEVVPGEPVCHVNYFEAAAFALWKGKRLPTEAEWEVAADKFIWGDRWEWTESAYLPYPKFKKAEGAIGEYNGKFMVNQMVMRGASVATPPGHGRKTYRNFFQPNQQWQFSGIRLAK